MPLNGKTHHHLLRIFAKKNQTWSLGNTENVKHSECAIRKISSIEVMGQTNFNKYVARGREDGKKCRLKETHLKDIWSNLWTCVS